MRLREYIVLAVGAMTAGVALTFLMLVLTSRAGVDLNRNLWLLAVPAVLSIILNIILIEVYRKVRRRK